MEINKKYELLAPVGDMDMFEAAICANADAVYLAGDQFGARAYASNFDLEQLNKIVRIAHKNKTKVYLTVNTLIKDQEFERLYAYLSNMAKIGVDALIVQDLGVFNFIKKHFDGFELHASTQMNVNNYYGAKFLEKLGFDRIVLGRETSIEEIKNIKKDIDLEIEFFVHGSLCVCVSGQCLMSSLIGQRSGNRGRCAQPCRKLYDVYNKDGKKISSLPDSFISARDLMTIDYIKSIIDAGVYSLKIEGRMKKPEYVYSVVNEYRRVLEGDTYDKDKLTLVSNRKFTKGLFFGDFARNFYNSKDDVAGLRVGYVQSRKNDKNASLVFEKNLYQKDIITVVTNKNKRLNLTMTKDFKIGEFEELKGYKDLKDQAPIYQLFSNKVNESLIEDRASLEKLDLEIQVYAKLGSKLSARAKALDKSVDVEIDYISEEAQNKETSQDEIYKQLSRLGNTGYKLSNLKIDKSSQVFIAKSRLNELRRELVAALDEEFSRSQVKILSDFNPINKEIPRDLDKKYKLSYEFFYDYNKDLDLDIFYRLYLHDLDLIKEVRSSYQGQIFFVMPRILEKKDYEELQGQIDENISLIDGFSAQTLGDIEALNSYGKIIHLDPSLNIFNSYAMDFYRQKGIKDFSLSHELNAEEISELSFNQDDLIEIQAFGRIGQMLLKHCPASIIKGCKDDSNCKTCPFNRELVLKNDLDKMLVNRAYGYSEVLTDSILNLINEKDKLDKTGVSLLRIVDRGEKDIFEAVKNFEKLYLDGQNLKEKKNKKTYTGHFNLGVI